MPFPRLLSPLQVTSRRPGANIKFYSRSIRFRKPERGLRGLPIARGERSSKGGRRGRTAKRRRGAFSALRDAGVVVVTEFTGSIGPREAGPSFIISAEGRLRRCLGTNGAVLKSGGLTDANKRSERARKLVRVRGDARVRLYTPTTRPGEPHERWGPRRFTAF